jgi:hypothetical protein
MSDNSYWMRHFTSASEFLRGQRQALRLDRHVSSLFHGRDILTLRSTLFNLKNLLQINI